MAPGSPGLPWLGAARLPSLPHGHVKFSLRVFPWPSYKDARQRIFRARAKPAGPHLN